jgi:hypothetical protein
MTGKDCPSCGEILDAHRAFDGSEEQPKPDDLGICYYCGTVFKFDKELNRVSMPAEEIAELPEQLRLELFAARMMVRMRDK